MKLKTALRPGELFNIVNGIKAAQLTMPTASDVGDVVTILQKAEKVVEPTLTI